MCNLFKLNINRESFVNHCRDYINQTNPQPLGVEVGVLRGDFSFHILNSCSNIKLFSIDCWKNQTNETYTDINNATPAEFEKMYLDVLNRSSLFLDRSVIVRKYSNEAAEMFKDNSLDFIYLDANHKYEEVKADIEMWFPKLKSNGIISGHDFIEDGIRSVVGVPTDFGVQKAVKEFFKDKLIFYTTEAWANWFHIKQ